ncbi:MAG: bifunctional metallophosphatase/5'-nucleotidase [Lachnospiraceae bacterium]|nr:bifunctional metallophosphatase/5'-nucleotidase [Lachnospiraceae bacterium]
MKKRFLSNFAGLLLLAVVACSNQVARTDVSSTTKAILQHDLKLIVTSDIHAGVDKNYTLAGVYELRKEYEEKGDYTLLIDDGDLLQGELISSMSKGEDLMDIANAAGYDIMTIGNHEFDYDMDQFFSNAAKLNSSYISCNFNKDGELLFKPYVIKEFDGVKFAFIGITTPETLTSSTPRFFQDENGNFIYGFFQGNDGETFYNVIQENIDAVKREGADYVIAVAHVGEKETSIPYRYNDIISHTHGFDVFLDGHSHDTDQVIMKDMDGHDVFRMGVGTKLSCVGVVTFTKEGTIEHELITYEAPAEGEMPKTYDNVVSRLVAEKSAKIEDSMVQVIGSTDFPLYIYDPKARDNAGQPIRLVRRTETNLGDFIADAYKLRTGADCAFANGGGIRDDIKKGDIKIIDVKTVQSFGNTVCVVEVTGQQILDAMEWGCRVVPAENGAFPQVSGITFDLDTSIPDPCKIDDNGNCIGIDGERRVKNLKINGEDVDLMKKYKLATFDYIAIEHGNGYTAFDGCDIIDRSTAEDFTMIIDYIKEDLGGRIPDKYADPYGDGRINVT